MDYNSLQSPDRAANLVDRKKIGMLVAKKYDGVRIERRDQSRINDLPKGQKDRLVTHGLLEGKPDIPTLSGLIDYHKTLCSAKSKGSHLRDKRLYRYLLEFFPAVTQKDCIVGNSEQIRNDHYEQLNMSGEVYAELGVRLLPKDWAEWGAGKAPIESPIFFPFGYGILGKV